MQGTGKQASKERDAAAAQRCKLEASLAELESERDVLKLEVCSPHPSRGAMHWTHQHVLAPFYIMPLATTVSGPD